MPYIKEIIIAGKTIEINKYYTQKYKSKKTVRGPIENNTKEAQLKINNRLAEKKLRLLLNTNFKENDYHLVLNYEKNKRPVTKEDMQHDIKTFLKKLRTEYKKQDKELKYVHVIERGSRGALHHHLVINNIDPKVVTKIWTKGRCNFNPLDSSGQYKQLASYLLKYTNKVIGTEDELSRKRWSSSRNLDKPIVKKEIIKKADSFKTDATIPKKYKNYYVDKNSIKAGIHEGTGYMYFSYTLIRIE